MCFFQMHESSSLSNASQHGHLELVKISADESRKKSCSEDGERGGHWWRESPIVKHLCVFLYIFVMLLLLFMYL